jgi:hypothetical protein
MASRPRQTAGRFFVGFRNPLLPSRPDGLGHFTKRRVQRKARAVLHLSSPSLWEKGWARADACLRLIIGSVAGVSRIDAVCGLNSQRCGLSQRAGQRTEGAWWMPWRLWPMKDVARRRNAAGSCRASGSADLRMGQPGPGDTGSLRGEHIATRAGTGGTETS